jgi:hypothetical protein
MFLVKIFLALSILNVNSIHKKEREREEEEINYGLLNNLV